MPISPQEAALRKAAESRQSAKDQLLQTGQQYVAPRQQTGQLPSNPVQLFAYSSQGIQDALGGSERRAAEQRNLDAIEALRREQMLYDRGQATLARDDRLASQALDEAFRRDQMGQQQSQFEQTFQAGRDDAASLAQYRRQQLAAQQQTRPQIIQGVDDQGKPAYFSVDSQGKGTAIEGVFPQGKASKYQKLDANRLFDPSTGETINVKPDELTRMVDGVEYSVETGYPAKFTAGQVTNAQQATQNVSDTIAYDQTLGDVTNDDIGNISGLLEIGPAILPETRASEGKLNKIIGKEFMKSYANLKGGGQITEIEGAKATAADNEVIDQATGLIQKGLPEETYQKWLRTKSVLNNNNRRVNEYIERTGNQPTSGEAMELLYVPDDLGNLLLAPDGSPITEADLAYEMARTRSNQPNWTRQQVIDWIAGGYQ